MESSEGCGEKRVAGQTVYLTKALLDSSGGCVPQLYVALSILGQYVASICQHS